MPAMRNPSNRISATDYIGKFMHWTDEFRGKFGIRANAQISRGDAKVARQFGAEGIKASAAPNICSSRRTVCRSFRP